MAEQDSRNLGTESGRYFKRNISLAMATDLGWGFACALIAIGPIITVFLKRLGASNLVIGLAPVAMTIGMGLWQLPSAHFTRHIRTKKNVLTVLHYPMCLPWIAVGLLTSWWATSRPTAMIVAMLMCLSLYAMGMSTIVPLWSQWLPRIFSDRRRGLAMGLIMGASGAGGILGGLYAIRALAGHAFPLNFAHLFYTAGLIMLVFSSLYFFVHETVPEAADSGERSSLLQVVRRLWAADSRLRRFVLVRYVFESGATVGAFFAVYALAKFDLPDSAAGGLTLALSLGSAIVAPLMGRLGDQRGYRRVMGWGMLLAAATTVLALVAGHPGLFYLVFFLAGTSMSVNWIGYVNLLVEMSTEQTRAYYQALGFTATMPVQIAAPLLWGWLGDSVGLQWVFSAGVVLELLGFAALLALVDDPRRPGQRVLLWRPRWRRPRFW